MTSSNLTGSDLTARDSGDAEEISALDSQAILTLELGGMKLIEASAGTGKTHTIADLYLRHILAGRLTSQILIVTYTNAATEELRGRIQNRLYQALTLISESSITDSSVKDEARSTDGFLQLWQQQWQTQGEEQRALQLARLQFALRSLDEACISTIHSFCQRSLQEHALAGNQLFETDLLSDDSLLWEAATKDWWRTLSYELDRDTWLLLRNSLGSVDKLIRTIFELRNKPSASLLPRSAETLEALLAKPRQIAADLYQLAPQWLEQKAEIVEIIGETKVLSRAKKLPYHADNFDAWIDAADYFFNASEAGPLFEHFEYFGALHLQQHSKPSQRGKDSRLDHDFFRAVSTVAEHWVEFGQTFGPLLCIDAFRQVTQTVVEQKREMATLAFQDQLSLLLEALDSTSGATLAQSLRQQYPVAMIDEFQDTDSIQYRIFSHIYHLRDADGDSDVEDSSLTLIGDPKQAIYSFRGGDIFTYMQARKLPTIKRYNLYTNWRSQPDLVKAVNTLFALRSDAFVFRDSIDFHAVHSIPDNQRYQLLLNKRPTPAMTLWQLPQPPPNDGQKDNYTRAGMREAINQAIVIEITGLLQAARDGAASIDGKAVQSGDIAILVRQASEGHALSRVLRQHGIRTVTIGRDSVFNSDEARGLYDLLLAVAQCQDPAIAARSLASNLLHLDYRQIAAVVDNDRAWQCWLEDLADLQNLWLRHGFIAMFQSLLHGFDITRQLAQLDNSERRITNLLHLSELLQQQSQLAAGMTQLLRWFQEQFEEGAGEDAELRLEDDQALVKIVTIHKSKGLQYPIVFVPFLWSCRPIDRNQPIYFHDTDLAACIDLGSEDASRHWAIAEKERLAEDLRLLYVAVTRARSRLYLAWGLAGSPGKTGYAHQTALAYLLHSRQTPEDLDSTTPDGLPDGMDFGADLKALVDKSEATIECLPLPGQRPGSQVPLALYCDDSTPQVPQLAQFERVQPMQWRVNSFTALTRAVHQPPGGATKASEQDSILDFPAGSHVGLLLHSLLENLDFGADIGAQCTPLFTRFLALAGLASEHQETLVHWLTNIVETPLDGASLTLSRIDKHHRLNELAFDFALDHLDLAALNRFMQARVEQPLQALGGADFRGLITGVIDLVFEYQGRYYLADYKSNLLGGELQDYSCDKLEQAMLDRRYDLQSLIYALALHRLLAQRLPDYDYEQHFGGSYYLFLRAMRPAQGCRYGIHFERPQRIVIEQFDDLFRFTPPQDTGT